MSTLHLAVCFLSMFFATATKTETVEMDRWTPALSMKYRAVEQTDISPDGEKVAYVVRTPLIEGKKSEFLDHIWIVSKDGSNYQFTRGDKSTGNPRFSPDGKWLAFTTTRSSGKDEDAKAQLWLLPLSGGEARQLTNTQAGVGGYRWSPNGKSIAFTMGDPKTEAQKKAKEEKRDVILVDKEFAFAHLYIVSVDGQSDETAAAIRLTKGTFHIDDFDWSPDGRQIVFAHKPDPRINTAELLGDISKVSVPSPAALQKIEDKGKPAGKVTALIEGGGVEFGPRWSPDGKWIAYSSSGEKPEPIGLGDLYVIPAQGGKSRMLAETPNRSAQILDWSADSREVYLLESLGTLRHVIGVPLQGKEIRHISSGNGIMGSVAMTTKAGLMSFTWETVDEPWDVYISPIESFKPKKMTDLHAGVPRPKMGRTELLRWKSPDGLDIEGLLTYPVNYQKGKRYPIILKVHGGPSGVYNQAFTGRPAAYMIQYFAQEGFAMLRPNPRGSTGYGKDFRFANFKDWGYGDLSDLLSGVDKVIEMGVGDVDRQLLMGWSYGGYMTSFAVTQTDRFKAASMGAGLPNLISMVTTTDIGDYLVGHLGAEFWEDYETYEKHSATYHIKNVVTPTQVIHGLMTLV